MICLKAKLFNILFSSGYYLRISYTFSCFRRKRKLDVCACYCLENSEYCYAYEASVYFSINEVNETVDLLLSCKVLWIFFFLFSKNVLNHRVDDIFIIHICLCDHFEFTDLNFETPRNDGKESNMEISIK